MAQRTEEWHLPVFRQGKRHESWLDFSIFDKYGNVWSQFHAVMYNSQLKYNSLLNLIHTQSNNILSSKTKKKNVLTENIQMVVSMIINIFL